MRLFVVDSAKIIKIKRKCAFVIELIHLRFFEGRINDIKYILD